MEKNCTEQSVWCKTKNKKKNQIRFLIEIEIRLLLLRQQEKKLDGLNLDKLLKSETIC